MSNEVVMNGEEAVAEGGDWVMAIVLKRKGVMEGRGVMERLKRGFWGGNGLVRSGWLVGRVCCGDE